MNIIKLHVESGKIIKEMGSMSIIGSTRISLITGEREELKKQKTYWFMPYVYEETNIDNEFIIHELPESISEQIVKFIIK